jgi:hypothetical protein
MPCQRSNNTRAVPAVMQSQLHASLQTFLLACLRSSNLHLPTKMHTYTQVHHTHTAHLPLLLLQAQSATVLASTVFSVCSTHCCWTKRKRPPS